MIAEVFDQRSFDALPIELRRLGRAYDGNRTHNLRSMYSESAGNHCLDLKNSGTRYEQDVPFSNTDFRLQATLSLDR